MPIRPLRTLARRLAVAALPLALGLAAPRPATAQLITFPTCGTATLAQYLALPFCSAGELVVGNFSGTIQTHNTTPTTRTLADVLVQPIVLGNTVMFGFTLAPALTITGDAAISPGTGPMATMTVHFDVFGWPPRPGGSAYLPLLPLAIGNALDADPGLEAELRASLLASGMGVQANYTSSASGPSCVRYVLGLDLTPCMADPRGLALDFDGGSVDLVLNGYLLKDGSPAAGAQASATLGTIAVGLELPPLPATPETPVTTTPEPGTWALLATGLLGLLATGRRRRARER